MIIQTFYFVANKKIVAAERSLVSNRGRLGQFHRNSNDSWKEVVCAQARSFFDYFQLITIEYFVFVSIDAVIFGFAVY